MACLIPKYRQKSWKPFRTAMFLSMGLSGVMPMTHAALRFGIPQARRQMGWAWYVGEGICYVGGAVIYAVGFVFSDLTDEFAADPIFSQRYPNVSLLDALTYGEAPISFFTYAFCLGRLRT